MSDDPYLEEKNLNTLKIYGFQCFINGEEGPIKIGISKDVHQRLKTIQKYCPFPFTIICNINNTKFKHEKFLHKYFKEYKLHGEWFRKDVKEELMKIHQRRDKIDKFNNK